MSDIRAAVDGLPEGATGEEPLCTTIDRGRLRCVLNRPTSLNALTPELLFALADVVARASGDTSVHAVVVKGAGERAFSAGFDIKVLAALGDDAHRGEPLEAATEALASCPKPTVALVRGYCVGAGFDLAMSCDFRLATPGSTFSVPAIKIGTVYRPQAIERIWRILGPSVTKALFVLGRTFDAAEALRVGIVQQVVEPDGLDEAGDSWTDVPDAGTFASSAQKQIIEAFAMTADRSSEFWAPLDRLRAESVKSRERRAALQEFSNRRPARNE